MQTKSLKIKSLLYAAAALTLMSGIANADVILFAPTTSGGNFIGNSGAGNDSRGATTYTSGGFSVLATGFSSNGVTNDLYEKAGGTGEEGLGLAGQTDNEINSPNQFIQFQILTIPNPLQLAMSFAANSTTAGEGWIVWGTNSAGTLAGATNLASCTSAGTDVTGGPCEQLFTVATAPGFTYIDVQATNGNMLVHELNTVPLPGAAWLFGSGLAGLVLVGRRRKKQAAAVAA